MFVILNPKAGGGRALRRWRRLEPLLRAECGMFDLIAADSVQALDSAVETAIASGNRMLVAAGGDGTVNATARAVLRHGDGDVVLGAIGLGSSNDFHKPYRTRIAGVPCRIDAASPVLHDVGNLAYVDRSGASRDKCWLINASVGLTAEANARFNRPGGFLAWLKRTSTALAIGWAAAAAILSAREWDFDLVLDDEEVPARRVRNLAFVKNPHFAGSFHYGSRPSSGTFDVQSLEGMSRVGLVRRLVGLTRGRFQGRPGTRTLAGTRARLRNGGPFLIEFDGEVVEAVEASFTLSSQRISLCN